MSMDDEDLDERLRSALDNAFSSLDPQTREILSCHFGLGSPFDEARVANSDKIGHSKNGSMPTAAKQNGISQITKLAAHQNGSSSTSPIAGKRKQKNCSQQKIPIDQKSITELALEYGLSTDQVESRKDDGLRALIYGRKTRFRCS